MKKFSTRLLIVAIMFATPAAFADENANQTSDNNGMIIAHRIDWSLAGGFTMESNPDATSLEYRVDYGIVWRLPGKTGLLTKFGLGTGSVQFKPGFRFIIGPGWKLSERFGIGTGFLYKITPGYGKDKLSHVVSLSVAGSARITDHVKFTLGLAAGRKFFMDGSGKFALFLCPGMSYYF